MFANFLAVKLKDLIKFVVFLGLGFLILFLMYRAQSTAYLAECQLNNIPDSECSLIDRIVSDFKGVNWWWILVILFFYTLSNVFRAVRWQQLLAPLGKRPRFLNAFGTLMLGYFANLGIPRSGEILRPVSLAKYEEIPAEQAFATIVVERIVDILFLFLVIGLALILSFDVFVDYFRENFNMSTGTIMTYVMILGVLGIIGLLVLRYIVTLSDEKASPFFKKIKQIVLNFIEGLKSVTKVENKGLFWVYSLGIWVCYYFMTYLCFFSFEPTAHLSPIAGLVVFVFGTLGMVFPSPGGMGSYHYLVSQALIIYGVNSIDSFSFAMIIFFAIQLFGNILFGLLSLMGLPIINKES